MIPSENARRSGLKSAVSGLRRYCSAATTNNGGPVDMRKKNPVAITIKRRAKKNSGWVTAVNNDSHTRRCSATVIWHNDPVSINGQPAIAISPPSIIMFILTPSVAVTSNKPALTMRNMRRVFCVLLYEDANIHKV